MTAGWGSRTVRAAVFAAVCVLLAALGHVLMSGRHVPAWAVAVGLAATAGTGWCLAGRERGLPVVVAVVVAAQTALHSAFSLAQPTGRATGLAGWGFPDMSAADMWSPHMGDGGQRTANMGPADMGGADMGSMPMNPGPLAPMEVMPMNPMNHMGMGHMGTDHMAMDHMGMDHVNQLGHSTGGGTSSLGMLAAHLLAALLCGLWLAHGERAAFRVLRAVAARLAAPLRLLLALPTPPHRPRPHARRRHAGRAPRLLLLVHAITSRGPPPGTAVV